MKAVKRFFILLTITYYRQIYLRRSNFSQKECTKKIMIRNGRMLRWKQRNVYLVNISLKVLY